MFVFSLEDEISFQTVYNYFLRLCSFRNASEVPMVLVGTQGERARGAGAGVGGVHTGPAGAGEKATCSPLLVLTEPSCVAPERAPPPCSIHARSPQLEPPTRVTIVSTVLGANKRSGWLVSTLS